LPTAAPPATRRASTISPSHRDAFHTIKAPKDAAFFLHDKRKTTDPDDGSEDR